MKRRTDRSRVGEHGETARDLGEVATGDVRGAADGGQPRPQRKGSKVAHGSLQIPSLKPVGHQSTNWIVRLVLMVATAAFTSFGTTSPRSAHGISILTSRWGTKGDLHRSAQAMYLPVRGSHLTIWLLGSKHEKVSSETEFASCEALDAEMIGA